VGHRAKARPASLRENREFGLDRDSYRIFSAAKIATVDVLWSFPVLSTRSRPIGYTATAAGITGQPEPNPGTATLEHNRLAQTNGLTACSMIFDFSVEESSMSSVQIEQKSYEMPRERG